MLARLDAAAQQVEIPVDEHVRLASAGRRLEDHVVRGIDCPLARRRVGEIEKGSGVIFRGSGRKMTLDPFSASSNGSQSDVANVVLPAHRGVRAAGAHDRVGRRRRKFAALDSIDRVEQTRLRVDERRVPALAACEHRHELPILAEGDVAGLARLPLLATGLSQVLDRADGVDRQLQRLLAIGRAAQLVVDDAERPVLQQIDPIGFSAQRDTPGFGLGLNLELALERMLQQPLEDGRRPIRPRV